MMERRKYKRLEVNLPVLCNIIDDDHEILISSSGKVTNISLGGMKIALPIRLLAVKSRLVEYTVDLPEPYVPLSGQGSICWSVWDEENQEMSLGLELGELGEKQFISLESMLVELTGDPHSLFLTTLNN
ncbi:PilZ domain-containing protein [candidate division FCPU426 bacterium]|nr:PilZ domain-containing protein [candidate division FCPU426 bacterium]